MKFKKSLLALTLLNLTLFPTTQALELISHSEESLPLTSEEKNKPIDTEKALNNAKITLYNGGIALIHESRSFSLMPGQSTLTLPNISPQALAETLLVQFQTSTEESSDTTKADIDPLNILEKRFDQNILTPQTLLENAVGKSITIIRPTTSGQEIKEQAELLTTEGGIILRYPDRIETGLPKDARITFNKLPSTLNLTPTLSLLVQNSTEEKIETTANLSYLSQGFSWQADYMATLNEAGTALDLTAWVTLNNRSGLNFQQAQIDLIAGELNITDRPAAPILMKQARISMEAANFDAVNESRQSFGDFHLYQIPEKTDLISGATKQIALFKRAEIPVKKHYQFTSESAHYPLREDESIRQNGEIFLSFDNRQANNLGFPLPQGIMRIYQSAPDYARFLGEDYLQATPNEGRVNLNLGRAFDITLTRTQSDFVKPNTMQWEVAYTLHLNNNQEKSADIILKEIIPNPNGAKWELIESSIPAKLSHNSASWELTLPENSHQNIEYRVRYLLPEKELKP